MSKLVVGLFNSFSSSQHVVRELLAAGFDRKSMSIRDAGASESQLAALMRMLIEEGVPAADLRQYEQGLRGGGLLVTLQTSDTNAPLARDIMLGEGVEHEVEEQPVQLHERELGGQTRRLDADEEAVLPVISEELQVGKRAVTKGQVRVNTHVRETPVEEQIRLREERISVERQPVNRPATHADVASGDQTYELRASSEEPVVAKRARVVEEVVVKKDVSERNETIRDTVRRTEIDIEGPDERA